MTHTGHRIEKCVCGKVLYQCRCIGPKSAWIQNPCVCGSPAGEEPKPDVLARSVAIEPRCLRREKTGVRCGYDKPGVAGCTESCALCFARHRAEAQEPKVPDLMANLKESLGVPDKPKPNAIADLTGILADPNETAADLVEQIEEHDRRPKTSVIPPRNQVGDFHDDERPVTHCLDKPSALEEAVVSAAEALGVVEEARMDEWARQKIRQVITTLALIREHAKRPSRVSVRLALLDPYKADFNDDETARAMEALEAIGVFGREGE